MPFGVGVTIGWFSKPENEETEPIGENLIWSEIIDDFAARVSSEQIGNHIETISKEIRYATAQGWEYR